MSRLAIEELTRKLSITPLLYRFPWWKLYIAKAKLLLIRPKVLGDAYTEQFSFDAAELVKNKAISEKWNVIDLQANDASREKVTTNISEEDPDFVIHYDHGSTFTLWGQESGVLEAALDAGNVGLLSGRAASTVSCQSAAGLGPLAIASTATAYLGYNDLHWVHLWHLNRFTEASNAANYALLEGKTFQQAYAIGYAKYTEKYLELVPIDTVAASLMLHDRNHLTLLGNGLAKAY